MPPRRRLIKDPRLPWNGPFPYEHLARRLGDTGARPIGPDSTAEEIKECLFDLMGAGGPDEFDRTAWDELRHLDRRLLIDFFLYDLPEPDFAAAEAMLSAIDAHAFVPDFRRLGDVEPDLSAVPEPPAPSPAPDATPATSRLAAESAVDLGPINVDLFRLLEDDRGR